MARNRKALTISVTDAMPSVGDQSRQHRASIPRCVLICIVLVITVISAPTCYSAKLVFIRSVSASPLDESQFRVAADFYGLGFNVVTARAADDARVLDAVRAKGTLGAVIEAAALSSINRHALLQALHRASGHDVPLLIASATPTTDLGILRAWGGDGVVGIKSLEGADTLEYLVGRVPGITQELNGIEMPFQGARAAGFLLSGTSQPHEVLSVRDGHAILPILIESSLGQQQVFLLALPRTTSKTPEDVVHAFAAIAPALLFVRYASGSYGWHFANHYANFTIDDPWLREPYGYLDYRGLLAEMEKHKFHTTIAFIPWNYDRSGAEVAELFRTHPLEFSIAIHGNNHDHKEFTDYRSRPLSVQVRDIQQALARMDRFAALTGIPYDRVMIFPHSIAPSDTLAALKSYNFYATVNASNIPQDERSNLTPLDLLRPVTLSFASFPSISRYSTEIPVSPAYVAINQFLGNPLLFYDHSDFFAKGIGAFDGVADEVNRLDPQTDWCSLGTIARHLYALRLRDDGDYDVQAYGSSLSVENTSRRAAAFYIDKPENDGASIQSVTVSGQTQPYAVSTGHLRLRVAIPAGETKDISVRYSNPIQVQQTGIEHDSLRVYVLRMGSDFRDLYLARWQFGLAFISFYNDHHLEPLDLLAGALAFLVVAAFGLRLATRLARARTVRPVAAR